MKKKQILFDELTRNPLQILCVIVVVPLLYYGVLMISLIASFDNVPNYVNGYNWIANSAEILRSTPALSDAATIISEEWLLEIGYMNYDYGFGISEWSLNIMPFKFLLVMLLAYLLLVNFRLFKLCWAERACGVSKPMLRTSMATTGLGSLMVGAASMTMFWVVCCASPTWVVGLAMLGLVSVSAALALDPLETYVMLSGFVFLLISIGLLLRAMHVSEVVSSEAEEAGAFTTKAIRRRAHA